MPSRAFLKSLLPLSVLALSGCGRYEPRAALTRFPIGIYGTTDPATLPELRQAGFDSFHTYNASSEVLGGLAREARRLGLRMVVYADQASKQPVERTRDWPVDAWYLVDEPDVVRQDPVQLRRYSQALRAWDPARPQTLVVGSGAGAKRYAGIGDILMLDWYPVPHMPLDSVADQLDAAFAVWPSTKPLWMVVQAFDWRDSAQRDPHKPRIGRFPTHAELRFMSYLAVMHGARGLFYYRLQKGEAGSETLLAYPELWQALERVVREMRAMRPIFEDGRAAPLPFAPDPDGPEARAWSYRGREYVVLANRSGIAARRVSGALLDQSWRPLFELRRDPREALQRGADGYYLPPYGVLVLESPAAPRR